MAATLRGVGLGVLAADCGPVLFADQSEPVIGAAHAGWKGALAGILEATLDLMESKGARRARIVAVLGPCISAAAYEVGKEFRERFIAADQSNDRFFTKAGRPDHFLFDLPGYIVARLVLAGVGTVETLGRCTYGEADLFFSFRRTTHQSEPDYGRNLSAIALA